MAEMLLKPYELSVWEEELDRQQGNYKENKIAVIASNTLDIPEAAHSLILHKNVNGETTLTFSIQYRYFDPVSEEMVVNPFAQYLVNERKIKLKYDDQWYDFIIRNHVESTDGMTWSITAEDAFVLELSKNGYSVELNTDLNNNLGTAAELAEEVLKGTEWQVDSERLIQTIEEPLWTVETVESFSATKLVQGKDSEGKNTIIETPVTIPSGVTLYVFYSYIASREEKYLQFIAADDESDFTYDDNGVITAPNYRIMEDVTYAEAPGNPGLAAFIQLDGTTIMEIGPIYTEHHGYRLVYNQLMKYDPVTTQMVDLYHVDYDDGERQEIYHYNNYDYTTSNVVTSYITNGEDFNIFENGSLQGWEGGLTSGSDLIPLTLTTFPKIDKTIPLASLEYPAQIRGYLETKLDGILTEVSGEDADDTPGTFYQNVIFNSGFEDSASSIGYVGRGQEFVLRLRYGYSSNQATQQADIEPAEVTSGLRAVVAKYKTVKYRKGSDIYLLKSFSPDDVIIRFDGSFTEQNSYITAGGFKVDEGVTDYSTYLIDGVPQTPSTKYCYVDKAIDNKTFIWNPDEGEYEELLNDSDFLNYYYTIGTAVKPVSNKEMTDPLTHIGIFFYLENSNLVGDYLYFEDMQLTQCIRDSEGRVVTIGNIPTAAVSVTDCFYLKPKEGADPSDLEICGSKEELARNLGISADLIQPTYNTNSEKILTVEESHSNCFNILQAIAETFECWVHLRVEHDEQGRLILGEDNRPQKYVVFDEFAGKENFAGFRYGINLQSIERTIDSAEVVTKLIVEPIQNEYVDNGIVTIQDAKSNPTGESYLLNLDYFCKQGLIKNPSDCQSDLSDFYAQMKAYNIVLKEFEQKRINLEASMLALNSNRNVYSGMVDEAQEDRNKSLANFEETTGMSYSDYVEKWGIIDQEADASAQDKIVSFLKVDSIVELVSSIYQDSVILNTYGGLLSNINEEYKQLRLECYGTEDYSFIVSRSTVDIEGNPVVSVTINLSDYIEPFKGGFYDSNNTLQSSFESSLSLKNFETNSEKTGDVPCTMIKITEIPPNYQIKYGDTTIVPTEQSPLVIDVTNNTLKNYKLVPLVEQQGCVDRINEILEIKKDLETEFYAKYSRFIQEGQWSSQDYVDPDLYYLDALQVSRDYAEPKVSYSINVVDVSEIEDLQNYIFEIGDKTYIEDTEFFGWIESGPGIKMPAKEEVIVTEAEWHLDNPVENVITVQNYRTEFEDLFQRLNATVQTVQYNENSYAKTSSILNMGGTINQELLLASLNSIGGREYNLTSDGTVISDSEGILIRDLTNPRNLMRLSNGGLKISDDAGYTWRTAIDGYGINIGEVYTGVLSTKRVLIQDGNAPSFRWDSNGLSAYKKKEETDSEDVPDYDLKTYVRFDQYGLYGVKGVSHEDYVMTGIDDIEDKANFGITWHGFFIRSAHDDGRISITEDNDIQVLQGEKGDEIERIKIGKLTNSSIGDNVYGIRIRNTQNQVTFETDSNGDVSITGTINATGGNFSGVVNVGPSTGNRIIINGTNAGNSPSISSANYVDGAGPGWLINKDGDAFFNNITARGAIKTAVFEYAEIQAVGGVFLFRPSSTIRNAVVAPNGTDLTITVEKPALFKDGDWCKVSNYYTGTYGPDEIDPNTHQILQNNGLTHVYQVSRTISSNDITLVGAATGMIGTGKVTENVSDLIGGALVDMGNTAGNNNYGIGVNSSDNTVNLPARAISLFKTSVHPSDSIKVTYDYQAILGTLPQMNSGVDSTIYNQMVGQQGIFTNNMYIGDDDEYVAFYTDSTTDQKELRIRAKQLLFETSDGDYKDVSKIEGGASGIMTTIYSTIGNEIDSDDEMGCLYVRTVQGNTDYDPVPLDIECGTAFPATPTDGQKFIKLTIESNGQPLPSQQRTAAMYVYHASSNEWERVISTCQYDWSFKNADGSTPTLVPYEDQDKTKNQFIYIDDNLVSEKLIVNVEVETPSTSNESDTPAEP